MRDSRRDLGILMSTVSTSGFPRSPVVVLVGCPAELT